MGLRFDWPRWVMRQPWVFRQVCFTLVGFASWLGLIPRSPPQVLRAQRLPVLLGAGALVVVVALCFLVALAAMLAMLEPVLGWLGRLPFWLQLGGLMGAVTGLANRRGCAEVMRRL